MFFLQIIGALLTLAGLGGLGYCIRDGYRIRRGGLTQEAVRQRLNRLVAINLASVAVAAIGLAMLVAGLML